LKLASELILNERIDEMINIIKIMIQLKKQGLNESFSFSSYFIINPNLYTFDPHFEKRCNMKENFQFRF